MIINKVFNVESLIKKISEEFLATSAGVPSAGEVMSSTDSSSAPTTSTDILGDMPKDDEGFMSKNNFYMPVGRSEIKRRKLTNNKRGY